MRAFLSKVKSGILVLDLISELDIMAFRHASFSGAPFVYGLLHNFGGNSGCVIYNCDLFMCEFASLIVYSTADQLGQD